MKKNKHKAILKEEKKVAKTELTEQITAALRSVVVNLSNSSKKIEKLLSKNAKQLVKKLTKENLMLPTVTQTNSQPGKSKKPSKHTAIKADAKPLEERE